MLFVVFWLANATANRNRSDYHSQRSWRSLALAAQIHSVAALLTRWFYLACSGRLQATTAYVMPKSSRLTSTASSTTMAMSSFTLRLHDVVRPFSGEGDVVQWLEKLEMVAKLRGISDLQNVLPLFLEGSAYAVFSEMDEMKKKDLAAIKEALTDAFALNAFQAYERFISRKWNNEPVDVYLSDLRRLARLAKVENDSLLRKAFVVGLPAVVSRDLRALAKVDAMSLSSLVERARAVMAESQISEELVAVSTHRGAPTTHATKKNVAQRLRCFKCGGQHHVRNCQLPVGKITCWSCGGEGHLARNCKLGNEVGKVGAPEAFPQDH